MIKISGYLTQTKLEAALKQIIPEAQWLGKEIRQGKYRWDMGYKDSSGTTTVVEFDGDSHYRDSLVIKRDRIKDATATVLGYKTVRIPYWIQLTSETLKYYFNLDADVDQNFQHGFITTKYFPSSFCDLGLDRFINEICILPDSVRNKVLDSLDMQIQKHGMLYVIPKTFAQRSDICFPRKIPDEYKDYYAEYLTLGGEKSEDLYYYHLEVFFCLTMDAYVFGDGIREQAFLNWVTHIEDIDEASRFFESVTNINPYS